MNLFEDLVEELKDENLLEATVIETSDLEDQQEFKESALKEMRPANEVDEAAFLNSSISNPVNNSKISDSINFNAENAVGVEKNDEFITPTFTQTLKSENDEFESVAGKNDEIKIEHKIQDISTDYEFSSSEDSSAKFEDSENFNSLLKQPVNESEFYRRRATEEVSALKVVEHILSGIEREHMKISPKTYDDVQVSKALHDFLRITQNAQTPEHALAEFKLMQETESWYSSLSYRDKHISVGDLRRYCETSRPPLSSQALVSLARFYRNSPFSETVRGKFDMIITRLFSKEQKNDQRLVLFEKSEIIEQLTGLYGDWSSIPLYASDDDPEVLIASLKFRDFVDEANTANSFEDLIKSDFFNRLRIFKESTGENFFAPLLVTTAIESNIEIGNRYVELVSRERDKTNVSEIGEKYKYLVDQVVSDTTSRTLQLVELLKKKEVEVPKVTKAVEEKELIELPETKVTIEPEVKRKTRSFGINKWIIVFGVIGLVLCLGLFTWVEYLTPQIKPSPNAKPVDFVNTAFQEYFKIGKINNETLYVITLAPWDNLSKDVKDELLKKTLEEGKTKGYKKVHLIDKEGKTVGFASENGIDLTMQ